MALITCPECGKEISDKAKTCPNCGAPVEAKAEIPEIEVQSKPNIPDRYRQQQTEKPPKNSAMGIIALILSAIGCTFLFGLILGVLDLTQRDGRKHTAAKWAIGIGVFWLIIMIIARIGGGSDTQSSTTAEPKETAVIEETVEESVAESIAESVVESEVTDEKYHVGETWENKRLRITYTDCYEYTDYNQYNGPADGNKIICLTFEIENIGNSDQSVNYTEFDGYADGYEVSQSYAPEGTGLDFAVSLSAGRKGSGIVAFEVPEDAAEIEIEYSPNMFTSDKVIFVYE